MGPSSGTPAIRRSEGMNARKTDNLLLKTITGNWTEEGGYRTVSSWLKMSTSKSAGFVAVISQNDAMAIGARRAFRELSNPTEVANWLQMPFLGCDGLPDTGQRFVSQKLLTATVVTPAVAGIALEAYIRFRTEGKPIPERLLVTPQSFPAIEQLRPHAMAEAK